MYYGGSADDLTTLGTDSMRYTGSSLPARRPPAPDCHPSYAGTVDPAQLPADLTPFCGVKRSRRYLTLDQFDPTTCVSGVGAGNVIYTLYVRICWKETVRRLQNWCGGDWLYNA